MTRQLSSPLLTDDSNNSLRTFASAKALYSLISGTDYKTDIIYGPRKYKEQTYNAAVSALCNVAVYFLEMIQQRHCYYFDQNHDSLQEHIQEVVTYSTLWQLMERNQVFIFSVQ